MNSDRRPYTLTDEVKQKLLDAIRAGNDAQAAADFACIHRSTDHRWMARGEKEASGPYREFYDEVCKAESFAEVHAVALLKKEMTCNWRASKGPTAF